jgi:probable HAF family extracellular repeat protein
MIVAVPRPAAAQARYAITDLGGFGSGTGVRPSAINNAGQVAGDYDVTPTLAHAFVWTNGAANDLGTIPGTGNTSIATAINDAGQIAGTSMTPGGGSKAVRWTNGALTILDNSATGSQASGMNAAGEVVGSLGGKAALWPQPGTVTILGINNNSSNTFASGINAVGQIVGSYFVPEPLNSRGPRAFIAENGSWFSLSTNNNTVRADAVAAAISINGLVAGTAVAADGSGTAVVWNQGNQIEELGGPCQPANFGLNAINATGQLVGTSCVGVGSQPYLDTYGPTLANLNSLIPPGTGWILSKATGINDLGQITGIGLKDNTQKGFVLTPLFHANINFQPATSPVPVGYVADTGAVFGTRGNGFSYGWNVSNTVNTRDRNAAQSPDQRYDTLAHMQNGTGGTRWEIAVPNGTYLVHLVAGDPAAFDSQYAFNIENVSFAWGIPNTFGIPNPTEPWFEATNKIVVSDGRLTITNTTWSKNNKISFIDIIGI